MAGIAHPHDRFFRILMDSRGAAEALFRERLPRALVEQLADGPPEPVDGTFIDAHLRGSVADRLFRLRLRSGRSLFVYCLVEHKSAPEFRVGLQLLRCLARIWEQEDRNGGDLPYILPLVVYHGAAPWTVPARFSGLFAPGVALGVAPLDFEMVVVDVGAIEDARLSSDATLFAGLLELKYALRVERQRAMLRAVLEALRRAPWLLRPGLTYIIETYRPIDRAYLLGEVRSVMPEHEEELMSIAGQEWRAEGRREALLRLLERRFGDLPVGLRARVEAGSIGEIDVWFDRAIDASSLGGVFGASH